MRCMTRWPCFNPRAHAGRDASGKAEIMRVQPVSIHAPTQGATLANAKLLTAQKVSIHAPTQGATQNGEGRVHLRRRFNPRAHAGRDNARGTNSPAESSFNPRAHAGRDGDKVMANTILTVSIHAPTQGATQSDRRNASGHDCFNPRAHAGRDPT